MKDLYEELELEVIRFKTEDIITTSDAAPEQVQDTGTEQEQTETNNGTNGTIVIDDVTYTATGKTVITNGKEYPEYIRDACNYRYLPDAVLWLP